MDEIIDGIFIVISIIFFVASFLFIQAGLCAIDSLIAIKSFGVGIFCLLISLYLYVCLSQYVEEID